MSLNIVNTHDQLKCAVAAGLAHPFAIMPSMTGTRELYFCGWEVYHPTILTDPTHRPIGGRKGYRLFRMEYSEGAERKVLALKRAQQWVAETYGYTGQWRRNRSGHYVPAEIAKRWPIGDDRDARTGLKVFHWQGHRTEAHVGRSRGQTYEMCAVKSKAALLRLLNTTEARLFNLNDVINEEAAKIATAKPGTVFWHPIDERPVVWREAKPSL